MVVTFTPYALKSNIIDCEKPVKPNLLALYALPPAKKLVPAKLEIVIIYPFDFFRDGSAALTLKKTPVKLVSITSCQSFSSISSMGAKCPTPAFAIRKSKEPNFSMVLSTAFC